MDEYISRKLETAAWGESVVEKLAHYIAQKHLGIKGFTRRNLFRMRQFYETYRNDKKLSPLVRELSWTHNLLILSRAKRSEERELYPFTRASSSNSKMMLLFHQREVWQQRRSGQALSCRLTSCSEIRQHWTVLCPQSARDRQHPSDELAALCALRPKAGSPPNHGRAQGALCRVVGRLDTCPAHKQPEGFLDFEQFATGPRCPRSGRLLPPRYLVSHTLCEPLLDGSADPDDCHRKGRPWQSAITDSVPQLEQVVGLFQQSLADRLRFSAAFGDLVQLAD